ncbi:MAG: hypothetical protein CSA45_05040 [Gammaproteobacteria bacterium]|nr:MAG: hypothetical protein CSA45_05040 [Gammaproteobacteria bacterium]
MIDLLLEPFSYDYMNKAILAAGIVGAVCAFLSAYLMLRGWSLIGDALSHSVVPGVAGAYALGIPYAIGAFFTGFLAAMAMAILRHLSKLREDAIIGFVFTTFFAAGLLLISLNPTSVNVQAIIFGNMIGIADSDLWQIVFIAGISMIILVLKWKDLMLVFFDEIQANAIGLSVFWMKILFFTLLSACTVASLQTVGAILVIAMVVTPGATAYLLTDKFERLLIYSTFIGLLTAAVGAYLSYFLNGVTGALIVVFQTGIFLLAFLFAPKHGLIASRRHRYRHQQTHDRLHHESSERVS